MNKKWWWGLRPSVMSRLSVAVSSSKNSVIHSGSNLVDLIGNSSALRLWRQKLWSTPLKLFFFEDSITYTKCFFSAPVSLFQVKHLRILRVVTLSFKHSITYHEAFLLGTTDMLETMECASQLRTNEAPVPMTSTSCDSIFVLVLSFLSSSK